MDIKKFILLSLSLSVAKNKSTYATLSLAGLDGNESKKLSVNVWGVPKDYTLPQGTGIIIYSLKEKEFLLL